MKFTEIFAPEMTRFCQTGITNKKKAFEKISKLIDAYDGEVKYQRILDALLQREKIGTTALGHQVAIPHARVDDLPQPFCTVLVLAEPINFSHTEETLVDIIFGLVVPADYVEEHLQLLAKLTEQLHKPTVRDALRHCQNNEALYEQLINTYADA